jgi:hypothetical protein
MALPLTSPSLGSCRCCFPTAANTPSDPAQRRDGQNRDDEDDRLVPAESSDV